MNATPGSVSTIVGNGTTVTNIEAVTLTTGSGNDTLTGADGNDTFDARGGVNTISGGGGDNTITSHLDGTDTVDGGTGNDTWTGDYATATSGMAFTQTGAHAFSSGNGTTVQNVETLTVQGGSGDDSYSFTNNSGVVFDLRQSGPEHVEC